LPDLLHDLAITEKVTAPWQLDEMRPQFPQRLMGHGKYGTQGMVLRDSLFEAYVAKHTQLLLVISTHAFFLPAWPVETKEAHLGSSL
jgi:hypothetical protein